MPYYRNAQENDGFDDFDDFDDMNTPAASDGFDDFDDFDDSDSAVGSDIGFDDDFDAPPPPKSRPQAPPAPPSRGQYYGPLFGDEEERELLDVGPAKPPKEPKVRRFFVGLLTLVFVVAGIGVSAHLDNGFVPKDILSWEIGGATVGELFKITHAEELIEHAPTDDGEKNDEPIYTEDTMPDSVRYADFDIHEGNTYCTIKGYNGTDREIALPATYNGKPCTHIEANAFTNSPVLSIEIPDSYTYIGQTAFSGCSITDLYLPDSVTEIGWGMCSGNEYLQSVRLSPSLEVISEWSFANCVSLTDLDIPGSITTVGQWAFTDCTALEKLTLNEGTVILDNCAFYGCTELSVVVIPSSVTKIGEMCFRSCTSLVIVAVPETLQSIGKNAFMNCSQVLTFFGEKGGKWEAYAKKHDISFDSIKNLDLSESEDTSSSEDTAVQETPAEDPAASATDISATDTQ